MNNSETPKLVLPFAPDPFPGESIASWVIRLCGSHGYGFSTVQKLVNVKIRKKDWDEGLSYASTLKLLNAAGLKYSQFFDGYLDPGFLRKNGVQLIPRRIDRGPAYGFCKQCLKADQEPYLRWRWRYKNYGKCTVHKCQLLTCCPHCDAPLDTSTNILCDIGGQIFIPNLGYCKGCGQPLYEGILQLDKVSKSLGRPLWLKIPEINPYDRRSILGWLWIVKKKRVQWRLKFGFTPEPDPCWTPRTIGLKQYRNLNIFVRGKVAKALAIYRAEKHRQRAADRQAVQDQSFAK